MSDSGMYDKPTMDDVYGLQAGVLQVAANFAGQRAIIQRAAQSDALLADANVVINRPGVLHAELITPLIVIESARWRIGPYRAYGPADDQLVDGQAVNNANTWSIVREETHDLNITVYADSTGKALRISSVIEELLYEYGYLIQSLGGELSFVDAIGVTPPTSTPNLSAYELHFELVVRRLRYENYPVIRQVILHVGDEYEFKHLVAIERAAGQYDKLPDDFVSLALICASEDESDTIDAEMFTDFFIVKNPPDLEEGYYLRWNTPFVAVGDTYYITYLAQTHEIEVEIMR